MAEFFAVFNRHERTGQNLEGQTLGVTSVKVEPQKLESTLKFSGKMEDACVLKLEAASVAEAQHAINSAFPGLSTSVPIMVETTGWKES